MHLDVHVDGELILKRTLRRHNARPRRLEKYVAEWQRNSIHVSSELGDPVFNIGPLADLNEDGKREFSYLREISSHAKVNSTFPLLGIFICLVARLGHVRFFLP